MSRLLRRRRGRAVVVPPAGDYSSAAYIPRYALPTGVTYNSTLGWTTGHPFSISPTLSGNEVTLTQQGSRAANRDLLQTTVTNAGTDAVTIILSPGAHDWGDEILIPGVSRVGVGMTIRGASVPRAEGVRVQAADVSGMTQLTLDRRNAWGTGNLPGGNGQFRQIIRLGHGATKVRLLGLDLNVDATMPGGSGSSNMGSVDGTGSPVAQGGLIGNEANGTLVYPQTVIVDRCAIRGVSGRATHRGIYVNGAQIAVVSSRLEHFHYLAQDSQAFLMTEGGDGVVFENNYTACAYGENFMIGGGDDLYDGGGAFLPARVPTNIVIRRNHFDFPAAYLAAGYLHKNLLESKGGRGAVVERNKFTGFRLDNGVLSGQIFPIVLKFGTAAGFQWLARLNKVTNCHGFALVEGMQNAEFLHNLCDTTGVPLLNTSPRVMSVTQVSSGGLDRFADGFTMRYNTLDEGTRDDREAQQFMLSGIAQRLNWAVQSNIIVQADNPTAFYFSHGYVARDGQPTNAKAVWEETIRTGSVWGDNILSGIEPSQVAAKVIPGDITVRTQAELGLNAQFVPQSGSPSLGKGCDITLLDAGQAGVETGL